VSETREFQDINEIAISDGGRMELDDQRLNTLQPAEIAV